MNTTMPTSRYAETKIRVRAHAQERGLRLSRNKLEYAAKRLMAFEDGVYTETGPSPLTYADSTGEKATGRAELWLDQLLKEFAR